MEFITPLFGKVIDITASLMVGVALHVPFLMQGLLHAPVIPYTPNPQPVLVTKEIATPQAPSKPQEPLPRKVKEQEPMSAFEADLHDSLKDPAWKDLAQAYLRSCDFSGSDVARIKGVKPTFRQMVLNSEVREDAVTGDTASIILCMVHAYQASYMVVLYDGVTYIPLPLSSVKTNGKTYYEYTGIDLSYNSRTDLISMHYKGRGIGDCGAEGTYKVVDKRLVMQSYMVDDQCDGEYAPVTTYPAP